MSTWSSPLKSTVEHEILAEDGFEILAEDAFFMLQENDSPDYGSPTKNTANWSSPIRVTTTWASPTKN